ncbi:hypothetical protein NKH77_04120 [Streptomyces sp. M19]
MAAARRRGPAPSRDRDPGRGHRPGSLAVPALGLRLGFADAGNDAPDTTSRQAYDLLSEGSVPGSTGRSSWWSTAARTGRRPRGGRLPRARRHPGITAATSAVPTEDRRAATVMAFPSARPGRGHLEAGRHVARRGVAEAGG